MKHDEENKARAGELLAQGKSVNAVAIELGLTWPTVKKWRNELGLNAGTPKRKARKESKEKQEDTAPEAWDIALTVPTHRMVDVFSAFSQQEQADAIANVLQRRMEEALA